LNEGDEEDHLDFRWTKADEGMILNLNKPAPKTHQYRVYFKNFKLEETELYQDITHIVKLLINILAWIKMLKGKNLCLNIRFEFDVNER
jgi:hypothetical protein